MKVLAKSAIALGLVMSLTMFASAETKSKQTLHVVYNISDLPVWRTNGKETIFAPQVLVKCLQLTVDPNSWKSGAEIKVDERTASIIIAQTQTNHRAIADALENFRGQNAHEAHERINK